jgi:hypothetical protein
MTLRPIIAIAKVERGSLCKNYMPAVLIDENRDCRFALLCGEEPKRSGCGNAPGGRHAELSHRARPPGAIRKRAGYFFTT